MFGPQWDENHVVAVWDGLCAVEDSRGELQKEIGKRYYHDMKHSIAVVHVNEPAVGFLARPARRTAGFWVQYFGVGASFRVQEAAQEGGGGCCQHCTGLVCWGFRV